MKYLLILCFLIAGVFGQAQDIAVSLDSLRSADEVDQELNELDEASLEAANSFNRPPPPRRRGPRPMPYPRPAPYPRPVPYPRPAPQPAPYPRPAPYPGPSPSATVVCYASDEYNRIYTATAYWASDAQRFAMYQCQQYSYYCLERGCNYY